MSRMTFVVKDDVGFPRMTLLDVKIDVGLPRMTLVDDKIDVGWPRMTLVDVKDHDGCQGCRWL